MARLSLMGEDTGGDARIWKVIGPIALLVLTGSVGLVVKNNAALIERHETRLQSLEEARTHDAVQLKEIEMNTRGTSKSVDELTAEVHSMKTYVTSMHDAWLTSGSGQGMSGCKGAGCNKMKGD